MLFTFEEKKAIDMSITEQLILPDSNLSVFLCLDKRHYPIELVFALEFLEIKDTPISGRLNFNMDGQR